MAVGGDSHRGAVGRYPARRRRTYACRGRARHRLGAPGAISRRGSVAGPADTCRMSVSVVRSGHPLNVFGTGRPSDHPVGRAFDVWAVDGHPVVDPATPRHRGAS
ncbi:hypothetical protein [Streptomyces sp. NPDC059761]|uniref:hypothetical protein n=1 Tax=Streptomyces sp. NPDC059761 TaxID=3346937 RepID=UPI003666C21C